VGPLLMPMKLSQLVFPSLHFDLFNETIFGGIKISHQTQIIIEKRVGREKSEERGEQKKRRGEEQKREAKKRRAEKRTPTTSGKFEIGQMI